VCWPTFAPVVRVIHREFLFGAILGGDRGQVNESEMLACCLPPVGPSETAGPTRHVRSAG